MRVAAVQYDVAWEDKAANHAGTERLLADAAVPPGTLVVLPELGDTGFSFDLDAIVDDRSATWASGLAKKLQVWIQAGFAERGPDGRGRNCAAVFSPDGDEVGRYRKVHPFTFSRESSYYAGGDRLLLFECGGLTVCPLICYDLRFPELWRAAALAGAEVFTIGASWPDARQAHWRALLIARAVENQSYVVGVNRVGRDPQLSYAGGSIVVDPRGDVLAEAADDTCVLTADLDGSALRAWRDEFPALRDARPELRGAFPIVRAIRRHAARDATG